MKKLILNLLAISLIGHAVFVVPSLASAASRSSATQEQLQNLKSQVYELKQELSHEQDRFGYKTSKWIRNLATTAALAAAAFTVIDKAKGGHNLNFIAYGLFSAVSGVIAVLSEVGVAMTNDQVEALEAQIEQLEKQIEYAEQQI